MNIPTAFIIALATLFAYSVLSNLWVLLQGQWLYPFHISLTPSTMVVPLDLIVDLLFAIGLWKRREWARFLVEIASILECVVGLILLVFLLVPAYGSRNAEYRSQALWVVPWMAWYIFLITYLRKPHVKELFQPKLTDSASGALPSHP